MMYIETPTISDGLETWKKHYKDLENLPGYFQGEEMVINAKKRAIWMINMFEMHPNGLDMSELSQEELIKITEELETV